MGSACGTGHVGAVFVPAPAPKKSKNNATKLDVKPIQMQGESPSKPVKIQAAKVAPASCSNINATSQSARASSAPTSSRANSTTSATSVTSTGSLRSARKGGRKAAGNRLNPGRVVFKTTQMVITRALTLQEHERLEKLKEESEFSITVSGPQC